MLIRKTLEFAGPAFIKWGQWASTRYDVFPAVLCHELEKLQSTAPEHKWEHTKSTLERVYGDTFDHIFESFDEHPMASGSIAQVHRATLREGVAESSKKRQDLFSRFNYALIAGVEMLLSGQGFNAVVDGRVLKLVLIIDLIRLGLGLGLGLRLGFRVRVRVRV